MVQQGRITLIEHNIVEALHLSLHDMPGAMGDVNEQIKCCSQVKGKDCKVLITPGEDLHSAVWRMAQEVVCGNELEPKA